MTEQMHTPTDATQPKLSVRGHKLLSALCECDPGKGAMLGPEARRVAGPLLSAGYLMWIGFGKVRVYSATNEGRAALSHEVKS